jgi:hypothetical protein
VDVGLVAGVPEDPVTGRVEHPVDRDRQLDDAEVGPEVAAGAAHPVHEEATDLLREAAQVLR